MTRSPKLRSLAMASAIVTAIAATVGLSSCDKDKAPPATSKLPGPSRPEVPNPPPAGQANAPIVSSGPKDPKKLAAQGEKLFTTLGCNACHSADGSARMGPSLFGLYGTTVELTDGTKVQADDAYIRASIIDPSSQVVKGYLPTMTPYRGRVDDTEIEALTEWMKTLK